MKSHRPAELTECLDGQPYDNQSCTLEVLLCEFILCTFQTWSAIPGRILCKSQNEINNTYLSFRYEHASTNRPSP